MTYKEFREWAEGEGYEVEDTPAYIAVHNKNGISGAVRKNGELELANDHWGFTYLSTEDKKNLFDKLMELAATPLEKREEPKRYKLKHKWMRRFANYNYLNFSNDDFFLENSFGTEDFQVEFTKADIERIKEKYQTDLSDFEIIEVE